MCGNMWSNLLNCLKEEGDVCSFPGSSQAHHALTLPVLLLSVPQCTKVCFWPVETESLHYSWGDFRGNYRGLPTAQLKINLSRSSLCHQSNERREIPVKSSCSYFMKIKGTFGGFERYITVTHIYWGGKYMYLGKCYNFFSGLEKPEEENDERVWKTRELLLWKRENKLELSR